MHGDSCDFSLRQSLKFTKYSAAILFPSGVPHYSVVSSHKGLGLMNQTTQLLSSLTLQTCYKINHYFMDLKCLFFLLTAMNKPQEIQKCNICGKAMVCFERVKLQSTKKCSVVEKRHLVCLEMTGN